MAEIHRDRLVHYSENDRPELIEAAKKKRRELAIRMAPETREEATKTKSRKKAD